MEEQILDIELHPGEEVIDIIEGVLKSNGDMKPFDNKSVQLIDMTINEVRIQYADTDSKICISARVAVTIEEKIT